MPETRRTAMFSLNGWMLRSEETSMFASATPITVTATSPASCSIMLHSTNTAITIENSTGTLRYSGTAPRGNR